MGLNTRKFTHASANFAQKIEYAIPMTVDSANIALSGLTRPLIAGQIMATASAETRAQKVVKFVPWTLTTAMTGANNDITFTAKYPNTVPIIEFLDPAANNATLSVQILRANTITVNLATGSGGAITSTANEVIALINAHPVAKTIVTAAVKAGDTGATAVIALSATPLAGGNYPVGYLADTVDVYSGDIPVSIIKRGVLLDTITDIGLPGIQFIKQ